MFHSLCFYLIYEVTVNCIVTYETTISNSWHCIWWCEACMQLPGHGNSIPAQFLLILMDQHSFVDIYASMHLSTRWPHSVSLCGLPLHVPTVPKYHFQLTMEYLAGMKFHKLTYCKSGLLLQNTLESYELFRTTN